MFCKQQMFLYKSFTSLAISAAVSSSERCISRSATSLKVVLKRPHVNPRPPAGPGRGAQGGRIGGSSAFWRFSWFGIKWWVGFAWEGDTLAPWGEVSAGRPDPPGEEAKGPTLRPSHGQLGPQPLPGVGSVGTAVLRHEDRTAGTQCRGFFNLGTRAPGLQLETSCTEQPPWAMGQRHVRADRSPRGPEPRLCTCPAAKPGGWASWPTLVTRHEGHQLVPGHAGLSQIRHLGPLTPCSSQGKDGRSPYMSRRCRVIPAGVSVSLYSMFPHTGLKDSQASCPNPSISGIFCPRPPSSLPGHWGHLTLCGRSSVRRGAWQNPTAKQAGHLGLGPGLPSDP